MSVKQAQIEIDSAEFAEWGAFNKIEPFLLDRTEHMLAIIASILVNTNRKKGRPPVKPEDFLLQYGKERKQDPNQMYLRLRSMFSGND